MRNVQRPSKMATTTFRHQLKSRSHAGHLSISSSIKSLAPRRTMVQEACVFVPLKNINSPSPTRCSETLETTGHAFAQTKSRKDKYNRQGGFRKSPSVKNFIKYSTPQIKAAVKAQLFMCALHAQLEFSN